MKQKIILALLIVFAGFTSCKDDAEVVLAPVISGLEDAYTVIEGVKFELNPTIENVIGATYLWQLNGVEVAQTQNYVFEESNPGEYNLIFKVGNEGGVDKKEITIVVGAKDMTIEGLAHTLISLELPDYIKDNGDIEWNVLETPSELYRFSQMNAEEAPLFIAAEEGSYLLEVSSGEMKGVVTVVVTKPTEAPSAYIANVFDYLPAPGQFVNKIPTYEDGNTHEDMVAKAAKNMVGEKGTYITLGGWGGYVVFGFDHTIVNVAGKQDFRIEGNGFTNSSEPGILMVSYDANGNGKPDDEWYEIYGSGSITAENEEWYQAALKNGNDLKTYRNFEMTYYKPTDESATTNYLRWTNNKGEEGYKAKRYAYPAWIKDDKISFEGISLAQNGVKSGAFAQLKSFKYGYVDNHANNDDRSTFDIDWAVDKDGNKVDLPGINFVKVYTGVDQENGMLGENSTEVGKGSDLHLLGTSIVTIKE